MIRGVVDLFAGPGGWGFDPDAAPADTLTTRTNRWQIKPEDAS